MMHSLKRVSALLLSFVLLLSIFEITTFAAEPQRTVRVAFPLQTGLTEINGDGEYDGYTYHYLEKIAQVTGWNMEYVPIPAETMDDSLAEAMELVKSGEVDLLGGLDKSPQMEELFEYTQNSYGLMYNTIAVKEDNVNLNISNFFQKELLRVGVRTRAAQTKKDLGDFLQRHGASYEFVEYDLYDDLMAAWEDGTVDVVPDVSIGAVKGSRPLAAYSSRLFYFAATKGNTALVNDLDDAIDRLNEIFPSFQTTLAGESLSDTRGGFFITPDEEAYILETKTIRVLCIPDCAPFVFLNEDGELQGIAVSIMNEFAKKTGLSVGYTIYDRKKDFADTFQGGEFDCILGIPVNAAYNTAIGVITSAPYLSTEQVVFSKHNTVKKEPSEMKIAMLRGSDYADKVVCKEVFLYDTTEQCMDAVIIGKADAGYGNQYCVEYYAQHNFATLSIVPLVGNSKNMEISIAKQTNPALLSMMNRYIENIDSSEIYSFHVSANEEHTNNWLKVLILSDPLKSAALCAVFLCAIFGTVVMFFFAKSSRRKNRELQIASNAKSEFLSRVSHDMRTPMNAILSFSAMDLDGNPTSQQLVADMQQINQSGQYLLGLINDVLDMSKIEHQKMELKVEPISAEELIRSVLFSIQPMMDEKNIQFHVNVINDEIVPVVLCDILRTKQVFINLLSNAAKFTPPHGAVDFTIEKREQVGKVASFRFTVQDNGIGMSKDFQKTMFEPFSQERSENTGRLTGTGLGLAIVKQLVDLMGGTISVTSEPHGGTSFVVELKNEVVEAASPKDAAAAPQQTPNNPLRGKHILLCEDHPINAEIVKRLLGKKEMLVDHAENGQAGVRLFEQSSIGYYDAILMDIKMPVMDGLTAAKTIRGLCREDALRVPMIAITANAFEEDRKKSLQSGMNAHISKPIDPDKLYETLRNAIEKTA